MAKKNKQYEITPLARGIIIFSILIGVYLISVYFEGDRIYSKGTTVTTTYNSTYVPPQTNKVNNDVVNYVSPEKKSPYVRKEHTIEVVNKTNYSQMVPLKEPSNSQEKWVIDKIRSYPTQLPRVLLPDYGQGGYTVNTIGKDSFNRHILPGINPDGEWSTLLYSNTNLGDTPTKMELGHNWQKWKDQGYEVAAFYTSHKAVSLSNSAGHNITSSIYPVQQSLSKGATYNFRP